MSDLQIRTEQIIKDYPGTRALDAVSVGFDSGRVHALVGKNGSGKSTLVKIFSGAIKPTSGEFYLNDEKLHFNSTAEAYGKGIVSVYQEMSLVPWLSVAENIFLCTGSLTLVGSVATVEPNCPVRVRAAPDCASDHLPNRTAVRAGDWWNLSRSASSTATTCRS